MCVSVLNSNISSITSRLFDPSNTLKLPGFTVYPSLVNQNVKSFTNSLETISLLAPGISQTFLKPFTSFTGRTTLPQQSCTYNCTVSTPAVSPVFVTLIETDSSSSICICCLSNFKSLQENAV